MKGIEEGFGDGRNVTLWVLKENRRAIGFYEKMGYQIDGAEKEIEIGGKRLVEVRMRKGAGPSSKSSP